jgi:hypothetical protein
VALGYHAMVFYQWKNMFYNTGRVYLKSDSGLNFVESSKMCFRQKKNEIFFFTFLKAAANWCSLPIRKSV